jgi:phosphotransferase family enzyme
VSDALVPAWDGRTPTPVDPISHAHVLDALAALHATFWEAPDLADPVFGFCSPWHLFTALSPATGDREATSSDEHPCATGFSSDILRWIRDGWALLPAMVDQDLADLLLRLVEDPGPLCAALVRYPRTLIHGDPRFANLGVARAPDSRVVLLDWHFVGTGVPGADLAWYLATGDNAPRLPGTREAAIARYRDGLRRRLGCAFDERWWRPQWELSALGVLLRTGCFIAWDASGRDGPLLAEVGRDALAWWATLARSGATWL